MKIPFHKISLTGSELPNMEQVLNSGWLTSGSQVQIFESRLKNYLETKYAFIVNSCTSALHLALLALGITSGDKVLVPTMTYTATAEVITYLNAIPVFLDIDPDSGLLTPDIISDAIDKNPDVKALIVVHFAGQTAKMCTPDQKGIADLCINAGIRVVEDCAHSFGGRRFNKPSGTFSDMGCFSFYANKCITTGEGGLIITDNDQYAEKIKLLRHHGLTTAPFNRADWEYDVVTFGTKYNMSDVNAAIGIAQLEKADAFRVMRQKCADTYLKLLAGNAYIKPLKLEVESSEHAWHLFPVLLKTKPGFDVRNKIYKKMLEKGIQLSVHYKPLHRLTAYREKFSINNEQYPNADLFYQNCLSLPIYPSLQYDAIEYITTTLLNIVDTL